jgi:hypothetical protein
MLLQSERLNVELLHEVAGEDVRLETGKQHKRQKQEAADHGAVEQHRDDGVIDDSLFLEDVVEAQQKGGNQGKNYPHDSVVNIRNWF